MTTGASVKFPGTNPRPLAFRGALVKLTAEESVANLTAFDVPWDAIEYDTEGFWSSGDSTKFTIPTGRGITKVRLSAQAVWHTTFGQTDRVRIAIRKNDTADDIGGAQDERSTHAASQTLPSAVVSSAVIDVVEGDYFELEIFHNSGSAEDLRSASSWFAIEVVESQPSDGFGLPTGMITEFGGTTAPAGFLLCDGAEVSKTTFAALFAVIGTAFDNSPAGGNFNVPDLRGRVGIGLDNLGGSSANRIVHANADTLGGSAGTETHTLTESELAVHDHAAPAGSSGFLVQQGGVANYLGGGNPVNPGAANTANAGGGGSHRNDQPWLAVGKIIKT